VKGDHQDKKKDNTNTEPSEELIEETIADEAPGKQVDRQWNKCLKEGWWKNAKITIIGENMWKIIMNPRHKLSITKCNMLKIVKAPKENHRRAAAQEHPERHSRKEIDWNDTHHSQLTWQLAALRTNVQTLPRIIIIKDPARGRNSIAMDHRHIKAIVPLPYEAIIKAPEIAALMEGRMLSLSNNFRRENTDKDTRFALLPHKGRCRQPTEGQVVPSRDQWTNRRFRNSNRLVELMSTALDGSKSDKGTNWPLLVWRQIDKTPLTVLRKTPYES
jgi:hypothetical protein